MDSKSGKERIMVLETKGDQLNNPDAAYKKKLMDICSGAFAFEQASSRGKLELVHKGDTTVSCSLIFEEKWQTELTKLIEDASH